MPWKAWGAFPVSPYNQTRSPAMNCIGVDLHTKIITACIMNENQPGNE